MGADLVIQGGTVIDGTGGAGVRADVAMEDGRVQAIGPNLDGERKLDGGGHVVAPGFIDLHTHYDAQVFSDPALTPSCFHGVTSVVAGNCGFSIAPTRPEHHEVISRTLENVEDMNFDTLSAGIPWDFSTFPEYLASVERRGVGMNFSAYIQADILGFEDRGYLRPGDWADVVVFDPDTVAPGPTRRISDFPAGTARLTADAPVGIRHVLVNGLTVQEDGTRVNPDARPGQLLRNRLARR
jgi:N-acyl-D-aspartate/D-glutamate deacylase